MRMDSSVDSPISVFEGRPKLEETCEKGPSLSNFELGGTPDVDLITDIQRHEDKKPSCSSTSSGPYPTLSVNQGRLKMLQLRLKCLNRRTMKASNSPVATSTSEKIKKDTTSSEDEPLSSDSEGEPDSKRYKQVRPSKAGFQRQLKTSCSLSRNEECLSDLQPSEERLKILQLRLGTLSQGTEISSRECPNETAASHEEKDWTSEECMDTCNLEPECIMQEVDGAIEVDLDGEIKEVSNVWVQKPFLCVRCGFTSTTLKILVEHNRIHSGFTPYSCAVCGYQTTRFWHIKNHIVAHTGKAVLYSCPLCDFVSSYLKNVKRHIRLHVGKEMPDEIDSGRLIIPPIRCLPMHKAQLPREVTVGETGRKSTTIKSYNCSQCDYKTAYHSNLIRHSRKHTGERPYPCTKCPYRAIQHSDLTRHIRTHTGEKPYECQKCNYKSAQAGDLAVHMKRHDTCEIYECYICGFKAIQKSYVTRHINRKHERDLNNHMKPK